MADQEARTRRAMLMSELLQGPALELRSPRLDAVMKAQTLDTGSNIEALWTALEALWLHHKSVAGSPPDHRGSA